MLSATLKKNKIIALIALSLVWIIRIYFFGRQRSDELYSSVDQTAMIQIIIVALTGLVVLASKPALFWNDLKGTSGRWWIIIYLFGIISSFWSANPFYSTYRAFEFLIFSVALMLVILNSADEKTAERNLLLMSWTVLACEVLAEGVYGGFSITGMQSNSYGATAVMIACYSWGETLSRGRESKRILMVSGIISTFLVLNSLSTASWWALLIGGTFIALFSRRKLLLFILLLVLIATFAYIDQASLDQFMYRQKSGMGFEQALTSRDKLWEDYWLAFQEKPLLGYGFAMAGREVGLIYATNAHNFIFAIIVGLGSAGFVIFMGYLVKLVWELIINLRFRSMYGVGLFAAFTAGFVNSLSLSFIGENWSPPSSVFVCLFSLHLYHYLTIKNPLPSAPLPDNDILTKEIERSR
jgi:O-antigen ligase